MSRHTFVSTSADQYVKACENVAFRLLSNPIHTRWNQLVEAFSICTSWKFNLHFRTSEFHFAVSRLAASWVEESVHETIGMLLRNYANAFLSFIFTLYLALPHVHMRGIKDTSSPTGMHKVCTESAWLNWAVRYEINIGCWNHYHLLSENVLRFAQLDIFGKSIPGPNHCLSFVWTWKVTTTTADQWYASETWTIGVGCHRPVCFFSKQYVNYGKRKTIHAPCERNLPGYLRKT